MFKTLVFLALLPAYLMAQAADEQNTFRLAQMYEQGGKLEDALRYYRDLQGMQPWNQSYFDGVRRCLTNLKRYPEAIDLIAKRYAKYPRDVQLPIWMGSLYFKAGDEAKAVATWDAVVEQNKMNDAVYTTIADEAVNNRLYDRAVGYLLRGRANMGNDRLFVFEIARAYAMQLKYDKAIGEYIEYLQAVPASQTLIQAQIAQFSTMPDALATALRETRRAVDDHPGTVSLRYLLAWLAMEQKDYATAFREYREIDKLSQTQGVEVLVFARRAMEEKSYAAAIDAYKYLAENYPEGRYGMESAYQVARCTEYLASEPGAPAGTMEKAVAMYEDVAKNFANSTVGIEARYRLASIMFHKGADLPGAVALLRQIAPLRRQAVGSCEADILLGDALLAQGDMDGAFTTYKSLQTTPQLALKERDIVSFKIAELLYFQGLFDSSLAQLEPLTKNSAADIANDAIALSLHIGQFKEPSDVALKQYARAELLERQDRLPEAAAILATLCAADTTAPIFDRASLERADVLRQSGRFDEAAAAYENFLKARTGSILRDEAWYALGTMCEANMNNPGRALECYQRLLIDHPSSIYCDQARERIRILRKGSS